MMHETGHALGLKHSFEKAGGGLVPAGHDSLEYTVMSYSSYDGANDWHAAPGDFPQTLMMYDIAALQYMYGPNFETNKGDTTYTRSPATGAMTATQGGSVVASVDAPGTDTIFMTIWDGGGKDTYDFSAFSTNLRIDLRPGEWVQTDTLNNSQTADLGYSDGVADPHYAVGNIANALTYKTYNPDGSVKAENPSSLIENAKGGSGDDVFIANQAVNGFTGGTGHDTFQWLSLADAQNTLVGGGMDTITDLSAGDKIDLTAISGLDSSEVSYVKDGDGYNIQGNIDGVGAPEFLIHVSGNYVSANWSTHSDWLFA
jgi:serralysin